MGRYFLTKAIKHLAHIGRPDLEQWVSQLVSREQFLNQILDVSHEGILVTDETGSISFINEAARQAFGIPQVPGKRLSLGQVIEDTDCRNLIFGVIKQNREIYNEQVEIFTPRHLHLAMTIQRFSGERGKSGKNDDDKQLLVSFLMFTARDERLRERVQLEKMASVLNLAAGIAHEIGNPLNSINIHLQLLLNDAAGLPSGYQKHFRQELEIVSEETKRLDHIIRYFLNANRRKPIQFRLHNIRLIVRDVLKLLAPEMKRSKILVKTDWGKPIPPFFLDGDRVSQVCLNVIRNAVQAMPSGGRLVVHAASQKGVCRIQFTDTGIGIPNEDLPRIFDPYYTTKSGGSGLGLVIAYQIISEHGGRIQVDSLPGKGTTVSVSLPIRKEKLQLPGPRKSGVFK